MALADDWETVRTERSRIGAVGMGALRVTLLFGSAAIALALIAAPILDSQSNRNRTDTAAFGVDMMSTGATRYKGSYTIRKSVLQNSPNSVCIIRDNGTRSGDC